MFQNIILQALQSHFPRELHLSYKSESYQQRYFETSSGVVTQPIVCCVSVRPVTQSLIGDKPKRVRDRLVALHTVCTRTCQKEHLISYSTDDHLWLWRLNDDATKHCNTLLTHNSQQSSYHCERCLISQGFEPRSGLWAEKETKLLNFKNQSEGQQPWEGQRAAKTR